MVGEVPTRIHLGRRPSSLEIDQELPKTRVKPRLLLQIMCYLSVTPPSGGGGIKAPMAQIQPLIFIFLIRRLCGQIAAVILDNRLSCAALTFWRISFCLWQIPHLNTTTLWANKSIGTNLWSAYCQIIGIWINKTKIKKSIATIIWMDDLLHLQLR